MISIELGPLVTSAQLCEQRHFSLSELSELKKLVRYTVYKYSCIWIDTNKAVYTITRRSQQFEKPKMDRSTDHPKDGRTDNTADTLIE